MPKNNQKERREKQALLKAYGIRITCEQQPEYQKTECSICLKKIHKTDHLKL